MPRESVSLPPPVASPPYSIEVETGLLLRAGAILRGLTRASKIAIVSDQIVSPLYAETLEHSLKNQGFMPIRVIVPAGESHKTLGDMEDIYDTILSAGIERSTPIIGLGGGVITDMAGFAAATILRGVPLIQMPTTLLAMVDASVGGKTGVDHPVGKNLIGAFHQPSAVLIDPAVLKTLPKRELQNGLAECIKHEIIRDAAGVEKLEANIDRALALDLEYLTELVAHNVAIKARVVESDPFEKGERAHLNFGHTFGHAIETISHYGYAHGECVALGMVAASRLALSLNMLDADSVNRIVAIIARANLPTGALTLDPAAIIDAMAFDKKVRGGKIRFILPDRIGHVVIRDDIPAEMIRQALHTLRG